MILFFCCFKTKKRGYGIEKAEVMISVFFGLYWKVILLDGVDFIFM